jgi:mono/diheme cytochrome c family protein
MIRQLVAGKLMFAKEKPLGKVLAGWLPATLLIALAAATIFGLRYLPGAATDREAAAETFASFCADCHNGEELAGNLDIDPAELTDIGAHADVWEKVVLKLNARSMPPAGEPRPERSEYASIAAYLEAELDAAAAAAPNPGSLPQLHRLTRTEYTNAIRDLLAVDNLPAEMNYELLLPADNASSGFDNIADLLFVSPVIMERYLGAAQKIARLAVGDLTMPTMVNIHRMPLELPQDDAVEGLPFGTRGGFVTKTYFPLDAEYVVALELAGFAREAHEIEITVDGERVALGAAGRRGADLEFRVPVAAGPHVLGATFVRRTHALDESTVRVQQRSRGTLPALEVVTISGPYAATGPGQTPSRERIFVCQPDAAADEASCAREILGSLARRAYRRAPTDQDIDVLMQFFADGRAAGNFDSGIQRALERILVSPSFLYRIERIPDGVAPGAVFDVSPVELASRLSFFLWSSLPDERLLALAESGELADDAVLAQEVDRMLDDPRSESLVDNFAAQWLFLRDVEGKDPDLFIFRDYDEGLREAFVTETKLFINSILRENRSVRDLIEANYTFLNERLAEHYGIPYISGSQFRRVEMPADSHRGGLLGQGSILTLTSYPTRTSPVLRGKYVLDNLLATPPPPPPPNVPALDAEPPGEQATMTLRESMARHRANPECAGCHAQMDPIGFAFEHFDAIGRWREVESGLPIEVDSTLPDGTQVNGIDGVKGLLLDDPERFVTAVTEKLLMYALGRNVQYYDRPSVRAIVNGAADEDYTFAALIQGIVRSVPFRMRRAPETAIGESVADSTEE